MAVLRNDDYFRALKKLEWVAYMKSARQRFLEGEAATSMEIRRLYRRAAENVRADIQRVTPGTLRRGHLEALERALERRARDLTPEVLAATEAGIRLATKEAVTGPELIAMDMLREAFPDDLAIRALFADINERAVAALLARTRKDGLKLSDRVWRIGERWRNNVRRVIEDGVARGVNSRVLAREAQKYLQPGVWTGHKLETRRRLGVSKDVSYEALRLARTEMANAFHEGGIMANRTMPSYRGIYWRLSAAHPLLDVCDDMSNSIEYGERGFYPQGEEPLRPHPHCFCVTLPAHEDPARFAERLRAWMRDPANDLALERWYNDTAKRFLPRPSKVFTGFGGGPAAGGAGGGETPGGAVVQALIAHGISDTTARVVDDIGRGLRQRTRAAGVEFAAMVDAESGVRLGEIRGGIVNEVDVAAHLRQMAPGRRYVQIHTHPASSSFSGQDAGLMVTYGGIHSMVVAGADGTVYILSKSPMAAIPDRTAVRAAYYQEKAQLQPKYDDLVSRGQLPADNDLVWKEHSHEIWQNITSRLGLRYTRVLPGDAGEMGEMGKPGAPKQERKRPPTAEEEFDLIDRGIILDWHDANPPSYSQSDKPKGDDNDQTT